ncbi:MAG: hypothetical protein AAGF11_16930 [Myxococcota bacterium]
MGATTGGALARLTREGDASAIERRLHETFLRIGKHEEHFDTKLAELRPLVQRYLRLAKALRRTPGASKAQPASRADEDLDDFR